MSEWFSQHLERPRRFRRSRCPRAENKGVCWFKSSANKHLAKIHEMICVLEMNDIYVRMLKKHRPGYIVYEDDYQVVAEPFADLRL